MNNLATRVRTQRGLLRFSLNTYAYYRRQLGFANTLQDKTRQSHALVDLNRCRHALRRQIVATREAVNEHRQARLKAQSARLPLIEAKRVAA